MDEPTIRLYVLLLKINVLILYLSIHPSIHMEKSTHY